MVARDFDRLLREKGLRVTAPRLEILMYLDGNNEHPDADEIYNIIKKRHPNLSRTTVYNTLDAFADTGIVTPLMITETERRYEMDQGMHHHLKCRQCKRIIDIKFCCPNKGKVISGGHRIEKVQGYFKGVCKSCLKAAERK